MSILDKEKIHSFAKKYLEYYSDSQTAGHQVEETFADECFSLGFKMDCGESFSKTFPNINWNNAEEIKAIISKVNDIELLGSAIFSNWRYITHWDYCGNLLSEENRKWFIIMFSRLLELSEK